MAEDDFWGRCLSWLEGQISQQDLSTWVRPLQVRRQPDRLLLLAPNRMIMERVKADYSSAIQRALLVCEGDDVVVEVATLSPGTAEPRPVAPSSDSGELERRYHSGKLDPRHRFETFIQGKSNSQARAAAQRVAESPGVDYNPLLIYGSTGLGKTHLMNAIGNALLARNPGGRVVYVGAEQWMSQFVGALRHNSTEEFKAYYRTADALLIDDIHFFAGKASTQEEFFHTFNSLIEARRQIVLTSDRFPKELDRLDERLKSRFTWGLTVSIEPPDLETRVAILLAKAETLGLKLETEVAFFIAQSLRSNVRELEGALLRLSAGVRFQGEAVTVDYVRNTLRDMMAHYERLVTIDNIMATVSKYYNIPIKELRSPRRSRMLARPRQIAMALARELTQHSLPEIGSAFEKDHTTVLHACRTIGKLKAEDSRLREDYENLVRQLSY
ncbi:MAG TPA: chromosomal replication initiator protein DnaA [Nevskiaceae bacterium]|nr:chromosomal replication initiator protein DnaA [Nevskiaceae bacterium]